MIRKAEITDQPRIADLSQIVLTIHADAMPDRFKHPADSSLFASWFSEKFEDSRAWIAVAEVSGEVVGYIYAQEEERRDSWVFQDGKVFLLHHIVVEPKCENQGIGQAMMDALTQEARARGLGHFELEVWDFNRKAQNFFKNNGFKPLSLTMSRTKDS